MEEKKMNDRIKQKCPDNKPQINPLIVKKLAPDDWNVLKYAKEIRGLDLKRDPAALRAYQMFCNHDPEKCSNKIGSCNKCKHRKSSTCGIAWKNKKVAIRKSSQSRWSEFFLTFAFYLADVHERKVNYCMPSEKFLEKWSKERINKKCINDSRRLRKLCGRAGNIISVGAGEIRLLGLNESNSYEGGDIIVDELSEVKNPSNYTSLRKTGCDDFEISFSTPKFEYRDISEEYKHGTRHRWHIKCDKCGSMEKLYFPAHINTTTFELECKECGAVLDRRKDGIWIAENPNAKYISLQYESTFTQHASLEDMVKMSTSNNIDVITCHFWHQLGIPFGKDPKSNDDLLVEVNNKMSSILSALSRIEYNQHRVDLHKTNPPFVNPPGTNWGSTPVCDPNFKKVLKEMEEKLEEDK